MLKQLLMICFIGFYHIGVTQSCVVDLGFNHNSNNLIGFFDADVESHCEVSSYYWDFGDASTSNLSSPVHTFPAPGFYLVCLSVELLQEEENEIYSYCESVSIGMATPCSVVAHPNLQSIEETLIAQSASTSGINTQILSHDWDFGDGATASGEDLLHSYETQGTYTVCLTVNGVNGNETCSATACKAHVFDLEFPEINVFFSLEDLGSCEFKANSETIIPSDVELVSRTWVLNGEEHNNEALVFEWSNLNESQELCLRETFSFYGELEVLDYCFTLNEMCQNPETSVEPMAPDYAQVFIAGNGGNQARLMSNEPVGLVQVYSMEGRLILETRSAENEYHFDELSAGNYIVHVNKAHSLALLIQR